MHAKKYKPGKYEKRMPIVMRWSNLIKRDALMFQKM